MWVAVCSGLERTGTCHLEFYHIVGIRHRVALGINCLYSKVDQVVAVSGKLGAVSLDTQGLGLAGRAYYLLISHIAVGIVGNNTDFARLVDNVVPAPR